MASEPTAEEPTAEEPTAEEPTAEEPTTSGSRSKSKASAALKVATDPANKRTVVLNRWPTEQEKTKALREQISKTRRAS